jgi:hypothetical protein
MDFAQYVGAKISSIDMLNAYLYVGAQKINWRVTWTFFEELAKAPGSRPELL